MTNFEEIAGLLNILEVAARVGPTGFHANIVAAARLRLNDIDREIGEAKLAKENSNRPAIERENAAREHAAAIQLQAVDAHKRLDKTEADKQQYGTDQKIVTEADKVNADQAKRRDEDAAKAKASQPTVPGQISTEQAEANRRRNAETNPGLVGDRIYNAPNATPAVAAEHSLVDDTSPRRI